MSSIYKLSIKGIRAFEPESDETIQFGFPLTLICGQNGCGKTTIIECLKYATTGNLPPNSKGGAFVHDPSLSSRVQTTGQVKLAFKDAKGRSMITTRTVQASNKNTKSGAGAGNVTFKTLEGQLASIEHGQKISISSKNAELDSQIPAFLGASPAILDNVIFCHQDDSLWPLSEASVLKKKFDDIFEASKFTKVIDNLKTIRKDMAVDIKLIEQSVNHLKVDKDRAKKIKERLTGMEESANIFEVEISDLSLRIVEKQREADNLFATNQEFQKILSDYENLLMKKSSLEDNISNLEKTIDILPDTNEELYNKQENFASLVDEKNNSIEKYQIVGKDLESDLKVETNHYNELIRLDGSLKAKKAEYDVNVDKMNEVVSDNSDKLKVELTQDDLTNRGNFKNALEKQNTQIQNSQKELVRQNKANESEKQSQLQETINSILKEEQNLEFVNNDLQKNKQNLYVLKRKLDSSTNDESELIAKKEELTQATQALNDKKSKNESKDLDIKMMDSNTEISKLEFELDEISKKLSTSNKQSELRSKLTFLEDSVKTKNEEIVKTLQKLNDDYKLLIGEDIEIELAEAKYNDKFSELSTDVDDQQKKVFSVQSELESLKSSRVKIDNDRSENDAKISSLKDEITKVIDDDNVDAYESIVQELEDDYRNVTEDVNTFEVTKSYGQSAIDMAEKNKCCLLCKRMFDNPALKKFIEELKQGFDESKIQEVKSRADEIGKELNEVKKIGLKVITYRECVALKPTFDNQLVELNNKQNALNDTLKKEVKKLENLKASFDSASILKKPLADATRLNLEVHDLDLQIDDLNDDLGGFGTAVASIGELQKQQQDANTKIRDLRHDLNASMEEKNKLQRELQKLENKVKDTKLIISNLERSLADVQNIKKNISDLDSTISNDETKSNELQSSLKDRKDKKDQQSHELKQIQDENNKQEYKIQKEVQFFSDLLSKFSSLDNAIKGFEMNVLSKLQENTLQMEKVLKECESIKSKITDNSSTIKSLEKEVMDSSRIKHNIMANIDYRAQVSRLDETDFQLNALDIDNAHLKKQEYQENSNKIRGELTDLNTQHAGKVGEVKQIKDQIANMNKELATEYKNVDNLHREEWIKLQTNLLVSNDIQNYSKALDNAIMKFHSIKMEDINRILNELWSQTYKGSDISTIAIKSDVNLQAKGNRSYNYRVVMVKDSNELDMRGRCSAGQKVLASILIRLALAECFGANCGMIALDEPTTNLDNENAEALAAALNKIIEYRKQQSNFQLIVITHDEKFLTHIQGDRFTDHFYRIERDEKSKSRIYSIPISRIQEF
ncbi:RAD50 [Candida jiufengensis]|uniref:RAD50 n=1 Tax=Candida jiufengensis TaxID=497108 RepID=UPI002224091B|nr:RAD50 [Candida jiufengensis]KAI5952728.1 RAD50 [Candida jiufengensis]